MLLVQPSLSITIHHEHQLQGRWCKSHLRCSHGRWSLLQIKLLLLMPQLAMLLLMQMQLPVPQLLLPPRLLLLLLGLLPVVLMLLLLLLLRILLLLKSQALRLLPTAPRVGAELHDTDASIFLGLLTILLLYPLCTFCHAVAQHTDTCPASVFVLQMQARITELLAFCVPYMLSHNKHTHISYQCLLACGLH